ncbi:MAG: cyclic nucleotide-binding domain-containing protein [Verrucomicrobiota bacterium]
MNPFSSRTQRLFGIAALAACIFIVMGSLAAGSPLQISLDKLVHGTGYAMLGALIVAGFSIRAYPLAFIAVILASLALEIAQVSVIKTRSFELNDVWANLIGLGLGAFFGYLLCRIWSKIRAEVLTAGERKRTRVYQDGATIFNYGDLSDHLYLIRSGKIALINQKGKQFAHANAGEVIGEMGVITQGPRSATAIAVGETRLYRLDLSELEATVEGKEHPALLVSRVLAKRLQETNQKLTAKD